MCSGAKNVHACRPLSSFPLVPAHVQRVVAENPCKMRCDDTTLENGEISEAYGDTLLRILKQMFSNHGASS